MFVHRMIARAKKNESDWFWLFFRWYTFTQFNSMDSRYFSSIHLIESQATRSLKVDFLTTPIYFGNDYFNHKNKQRSYSTWNLKWHTGAVFIWEWIVHSLVFLYFWYWNCKSLQPIKLQFKTRDSQIKHL